MDQIQYQQANGHVLEVDAKSLNSPISSVSHSYWEMNFVKIKF